MKGYIKELRKHIGSHPIIMCAAGVFIIDDRNRILLEKRSDNGTWGVIGGSLELGESLEEAAVREVFEEVGIKVKNLELFNVYSGKELYNKYPNGDEVYNVVAMYIAREFEGSIVADIKECEDAKFFELDKLPENICPPDIPMLKDFISKFNK